MSKDIYCVRCGEPTDMDELHHVDGMTFDEALQSFRSTGCDSLGMQCNDHKDFDRAVVSQALFDLLGDDVDGIASMMDDAEYLGYF